MLHSAVGQITESDIQLAKASDAVVVAFNVRATTQARELAQRDGVDIRYYSIIYEVSDDIEKLYKGKLAPVQREKFLGYAQILQVFEVKRIGNVAGCRVTEGVVKRGAGVRLLRDGVVIHQGELSHPAALQGRRAAKWPTATSAACRFANYNDIRVDDQIECYETEMVAAALSRAALRTLFPGRGAAGRRALSLFAAGLFRSAADPMAKPAAIHHARRRATPPAPPSASCASPRRCATPCPPSSPAPSSATRTCRPARDGDRGARLARPQAHDRLRQRPRQGPAGGAVQALRRVAPFLRSQVAKTVRLRVRARPAFPARHRARLRHADRRGDAAAGGGARPRSRPGPTEDAA